MPPIRRNMPLCHYWHLLNGHLCVLVAIGIDLRYSRWAPLSPSDGAERAGNPWFRANIRKRKRSGQPGGEALASLREVAERAGVSTAAASRALRDRPGVSRETRSRVRQGGRGPGDTHSLT